MSINDQNMPMTQKLYESAPYSRHVAKFLTASTLGVTLLFLSGLTLTGTVIALIMATPLLVIFSPVLVPAGMTVFLVISGFLFSGGCAVAAITALSWMYYYVQGKHPLGADQLDYARNKLASTARDMTQKAKEYGQYVQHKAREVSRGGQAGYQSL
ncbi:Oleosin Bn-III [Hibiscus syriacus]|uniref:Oleosin n=1 Tax=Hibiscus syriacus TaxID=106335 RepID=A0A6A3D3T4_HIBSY|nr:oleosin G-like [Hibiscus syriacus]KAE8735244.1 Oleosin Bn-III [Hibiscus syriacus]